MKQRVPHYYKNFRCIGSACKDNCCYGGWEIDIDDETAQYYMGLDGDFAKKLQSCIGKSEDGEYCFNLIDGHCPLLDKDNLCQVYKELGEDKMGVVCTQFPRFTEYYGDVRETGIGLACEEAERIIFSDKEAFSYDEFDIEEKKTDDDEYDGELAIELFKLRDIFMNVVSCSNYTIYEKMSVMLYSADIIQKYINEDNYDAVSEYVNKIYNGNSVNEYIDDCLDLINFNDVLDKQLTYTCQEAVEHIIWAYQELEMLGDVWPETMENCLNKLHGEGISQKAYVDIVSGFMKFIDERIYEYDNLLQYFIYRYFMKASYDYDVVGKIKLFIANFYIIRDMDMACFIDNSGCFSFNNRIDTVHIFSREVEYSEDNLEDLSEEFIFEELFETPNLIYLLKIS